MEKLALAHFSALKECEVAVRCLHNQILSTAFFRIVASNCDMANFYIITLIYVRPIPLSVLSPDHVINYNVPRTCNFRILGRSVLRGRANFANS